MKSYIGQTKYLDGVIFHYSNEEHIVESLFYTDQELTEMGKGNSPEYDQAIDSGKEPTDATSS